MTSLGADALIASIDQGRMLPASGTPIRRSRKRRCSRSSQELGLYRTGERVEERRRLHHRIYWRADPRRRGARPRGLNAGLVNICRHRRHEVIKGRGNVKALRCGYHGWTYNLAGRLQGAPRTAGEPGFRLEDYPLLPLRAEYWAPGCSSTPTAAPAIARAIRRSAEHRRPERRRLRLNGAPFSRGLGGSRELEDDAREIPRMLSLRHCASGFSAAIDVMPENYNLAVHGWFSSQVGMVRQSALEGRSQVKIYTSED